MFEDEVGGHVGVVGWEGEVTAEIASWRKGRGLALNFGR